MSGTLDIMYLLDLCPYCPRSSNMQGDASISTIDESATEKENEICKTTSLISKLPVNNSRRKMIGNGRVSKHIAGSGSKKQPLTVLNKK